MQIVIGDANPVRTTDILSPVEGMRFTYHWRQKCVICSTFCCDKWNPLYFTPDFSDTDFALSDPECPVVWVRTLFISCHMVTRSIWQTCRPLSAFRGVQFSFLPQECIASKGWKEKRRRKMIVERRSCIIRCSPDIMVIPWRLLRQVVHYLIRERWETERHTALHSEHQKGRAHCDWGGGGVIIKWILQK